MNGSEGGRGGGERDAMEAKVNRKPGEKRKVTQFEYEANQQGETEKGETKDRKHNLMHRVELAVIIINASVETFTGHVSDKIKCHKEEQVYILSSHHNFRTTKVKRASHHHFKEEDMETMVKKEKWGVGGG